MALISDWPAELAQSDSICFGSALSITILEWPSLKQWLFVRFGFHNASSIDSLLDKDDVVLEAILDEDDLLQECKAQNTRLIDYFQRVDVLQRLFAYVTGQTEGEEKGRFKCVWVPFWSILIMSDAGGKVSVCCDGGSLQRNMVNRGDMCQSLRTTAGALLGDCPR